MVAVRSKVQGIVVVRELQNQDARYDLVLSLSLSCIVCWSQCTKASDSFLLYILLFINSSTSLLLTLTTLF